MMQRGSAFNMALNSSQDKCQTRAPTSTCWVFAAILCRSVSRQGMHTKKKLKQEWMDI